jgi:hypothetical protein
MTTFDRFGFSRPVFRVDLVPQFLDILRELSLPDWMMVRQRLYTQQADHMIETMTKYKNAFVIREATEKRWYSMIKTYPLDATAEALYREVLFIRSQELDHYKALCEFLKLDPGVSHEEDWAILSHLG